MYQNQCNSTNRSQIGRDSNPWLQCGSALTGPRHSRCLGSKNFADEEMLSFAVFDKDDLINDSRLSTIIWLKQKMRLKFTKKIKIAKTWVEMSLNILVKMVNLLH